MFHHSPNVVRAIPDTSLSNPHLRGYYSWNPIDLLSYRLEGLVFPSALLATKTLRWCVSPATRLSPNIVLHFLGNGLNCGEVIAPILAGEELRRHWNLGPYAWSKEEITRGWIDQTPTNQARILVDHLEDCSGYFLNCAFHDENEYRPDLSCWYKEETFVRVSELIAAELAENDRLSAKVDSAWEEFLKMHVKDVNCFVNALLASI